MKIIYIGKGHQTTTYQVPRTEYLHTAILTHCPKGSTPDGIATIGCTVYVHTTAS